MATTTKVMALLRVGRNTNLACIVNGFHTSPAKCLLQEWRKKKALPTNPNCCGPLVSLPDFSYKDNRPTPYGANQLRRIRKHQEYMKRVHKYVTEIDNAVAKHARLLEEKEEKKRQILASKLKPKGQLLITDN
ncbi:mitochondrial ribosomal protein L52 [Lasioglossum baleicum]|uniref:mitochondrial ribosomal protein L52 n=1 Tax=Lasioglossum baleicum TaxID=434251 RepID=UPI003FCD42D1